MKKATVQNNIKHIHLIGVCGIAMGTLACMLKDKGFFVSGSDHNMYPPMSDILKNKAITLYNDYNKNNISNADIIIVGNAISRGNVELEHLLIQNIPYLSMADALYQFFLKEKRVIAITGTHGKTTTTAILAHIFKTANLSPSFLIGGVSSNYNSNYKLDEGEFFIIEGDEYDSAYFEKFPKFILYRPDHIIVTSLEFDHADIYNNLDEIELWFKRLVNIIPGNGNIIYNSSFSNLQSICQSKFSTSISYNSRNAGYSFTSEVIKNITSLSIYYKEELLLSANPLVFGKFNFENITAAVAMAITCNIPIDSIIEAINTFSGVKRRQELIFQNDFVSIYEDFAHHPTAIKEVITSFKKHFNDSVIWAIYEPRSATSRKTIFQNNLHSSFESADKVLLKTPFNASTIKNNDIIDIRAVSEKINVNKHKKSHVFDTVDKIIKFTNTEIDKNKSNIIIIMSNGGFGDIYNKIIKAMQ